MNKTPSSTHQNGQGIAIIAGRGSLPIELADGLVKSGRLPFVVGLEGETGREINRFDHEIVAWGQLGYLFKLLKSRNISQVIFAGGISKRPDIAKFKLDWVAISSLPRVLSFMLGGDNSLLNGVIGLFKSHGVEVVGAHQVLPALLAETGLIAGPKPSRASMASMKKAFEASKALGALDIGQAAIAEKGRVVAVEGIEGTDGMINRVKTLRTQGRLPESGKDGVLVKTMKPGQDMRVDLPAIGPRTIKRIVKAGLKGIAVEAGHTLILSRNETLKIANASRVFIYGLQDGH